MILQLIVAASLAAGLIANVAHAQVSDDVVRIGISDDMSGPFADSGGLGSLIAARMAVDDFKGQVLGKQVEIVSADHQNKSDVGSNLARKWFDTDKVDMITGLGNSSVAIATQQLAREKARITIVTNAGSSDLTGKFCSPFGFHWVYDTYALSNVVGRAAVSVHPGTS